MTVSSPEIARRMLPASARGVSPGPMGALREGRGCARAARRTLRTVLLKSVSILGCVAAGFAASAQPPAVEFVLDNAMKLVVQEDHRAPVVVSQIWYRVGSSYEREGSTGISHVLEHMMFKGTERHGAGEFSRIISEQGGRENAFTGRDYTAYFQTLERSRLATSFELEADRMVNLLVPESEFLKEIEVVKEERRMRTEDNPQGLLYETAQATAYLVSPYRKPVIGWMNDLDNMQVQDLRRWYERWYAPANATLVVVGDVQPDAVRALANVYYGAIPAGTVARIDNGREPVQRGPRRAEVRVPAAVPYLIVSFKAPGLKTARETPAAVPQWEPYALELLAALLGGDDSARLPSELIRSRGIAAEVDVEYDLYARLQPLFSIHGVPATGHGNQELEAAVRASLDALAAQGPQQAELERAKRRLISSHTFEQDSPFYRAMQIGILESVGLGWRVRDEYVSAISSVSAGQIQSVVKRYLVAAGMTVSTLEPQESADR